MDCNELTIFINTFKETDDFTGGVDKSQITLVQNELGVELPESFKWFLSNYGSGGMFGVDIQGVGKSNRPPVVVNTKRFRDLGLDENLVVIENAGEYAYCLYTSKMENNECPIIAWNRVGGLDDYYTSKNFYEFLSQRSLDAKEAWEEDF
jgi:hypothetical protein